MNGPLREIEWICGYGGGSKIPIMLRRYLMEVGFSSYWHYPQVLCFGCRRKSSPTGGNFQRQPKREICMSLLEAYGEMIFRFMKRGGHKTSINWWLHFLFLSIENDVGLWSYVQPPSWVNFKNCIKTSDRQAPILLRACILLSSLFILKKLSITGRWEISHLLADHLAIFLLLLYLDHSLYCHSPGFVLARAMTSPKLPFSLFWNERLCPD